MTRTCGSAKRQRVASFESALANVDVVSQLAAFLEAKELCQVKATCKALGSANDDAAVNWLSVTEEAARRIFEGASDEEKAMLPRYDGESWIVLYHHLLMLRTRLTFDQLIGNDVEYHGGDKDAVQGISRYGFGLSICGEHIMRAGKHWATFTSSPGVGTGHSSQIVGLVRPLPGWDKRGLEDFDPSDVDLHEELLRENTGRWEGDVHYCSFTMESGDFLWSAWHDKNKCKNWEGRDNFDTDDEMIGMLLDLDNGALSVYQKGEKLGTLKDGLAGEYCWTTWLFGVGHSSIERGYNGNVLSH
ncbi:hypothetical protein THAOC_02669 [Thalassiosira oceanica]|uniref:F-box domain-containing protein n=1 Tax=Thalassiosira oceanica TaxID=159749 RepID=K0TES3_THAOC|nr:hypothetical protein THAOC_02669 [Thalassiosira oceanica]|eukprot:EJK75604.1 hypothetical protein THAOC_02669 [Thalassiosira oceanica]